MSLLYECISGVIQGGILEGTDDNGEGEKIARICVDKLRGMILVEGDPNCMNPTIYKYPCSNLCSKIRCVTGLQSDSSFTLSSRCHSTRCYHGLFGRR